MAEKVPQGVAAIYVYDNRVIASASDFAPDRPSGFTVLEAQKYRAQRQLAFEVVRALSSPALYEGLGVYECEQIMQRMKGKIVLLPVGHQEQET